MLSLRWQASLRSLPLTPFLRTQEPSAKRPKVPLRRYATLWAPALAGATEW